MDTKKITKKFIGLIFILLMTVIIACQPIVASRLTTPAQFTDARTSTTAEISTETPTFENHSTPTESPNTPSPTITTDPLLTRPEEGSICGFNPLVESLINDLRYSDWVSWIEILSGEKPVTQNDETFTILTRYSESLFNGNPNARAYDFVLEQLRQWGYEDGIDLFEQEFTPSIENQTATWKNIIVVIPGSDPQLAQEQVLLTAHLDSTSQGNPEVRAPGADDNASGVATLLEAASVYKQYSFKRTIKIIFFTGEEQGLHGSRAYVNQYRNELKDIVGVFNLDMFGYDADNDRCFEMHVGEMKSSNIIGGCLADTIESYAIDLKFDYLVSEARGSSDHATFWLAGVGAIEILENFNTHNYEGGCGDSDVNPNYHTEKDLISEMNLATGHSIARAAIAAAARLAEPVDQ